MAEVCALPAFAPPLRTVARERNLLESNVRAIWLADTVTKAERFTSPNCPLMLSVFVDGLKVYVPGIVR